jgi:protein involved in polysaccharide export with SLBB domain
MNKRLPALLILIACLAFVPMQLAAQQINIDDVCRQMNLSADQCQAAKNKLAASGGRITPDMISSYLKTMQSPAAGAPASSPSTVPGVQAQGVDTTKSGQPAPGAATSPQAGYPGQQVPAWTSDPWGRTLFERFRPAGKYQEIATALKPFGHDFFAAGAAGSITERKDVPVPMNYVVGPGDEVRILLWGRMNAQYSLTVDRDGKITIPQVGPLFVSGMTFEEMSKKIILQTQQFVGANVDVSMGLLKTIPIYVLGDVLKPGAYTISSFATITDALLLAGGPTDVGSMRRVQLRRQGKTVTTFDLYDLFLKGDKSKDAFLQRDDVIFVPVTGPLVGVAGNVRRPAIYELKEDTSLALLFELAGGVLPSGYTQQIQVSRLQKNERQIVIDVDDKHLQNAQRMLLQDADLVQVFSIVERDMNAVYLDGNVRRPGKFEYKPGMRVKDVIGDVDNLMDDTYMDYAVIQRIVPPDRKTEVVPFNLGQALLKKDSASNVELKPEDRIIVYSRWMFAERPYVTVEGEIRGGCQAAPLNGNLVSPPVPAAPMTTMPAVTPVQPGTTSAGSPVQAAGTATVPTPQAPAPAALQPSTGGAAGPTIVPLPTIQGQVPAPAAAVSQPPSMAVQVPAAAGIQAPQTGTEQGGQVITGKRNWRDKIPKLKSIADEMSAKNMSPEAGRLNRVVQDLMQRQAYNPSQDLQALLSDLRKTEKYDYVYKLSSVMDEMKSRCDIELADNMRVKDAILKAGGLTVDALPQRAEVIRVNPKGEYHTIFINLVQAMAGNPVHNVLLQNLDRIVIHSLWEQAVRRSVSVDGEVANPGTYLYTEGMTVADLVFKAGGTLDSTYLEDAEISSQILERNQQVRLDFRKISLRDALRGNPQDNLSLKPYDRLTVKRIQNWNAEQFAFVSGEIMFVGKYPVRKGEKLSSLIERAGGYTENAYLRAAVFKRKSVRDQQQKSINEIASRMEKDLLLQGTLEMATSTSQEEVLAKKLEMEARKKFIDTFRELQASGRMSIHLAHLRLLKGSPFDIELEDGDELYIPQKPNVVSVAGAVMTQTSHIYRENFDYRDYIDLSGGYTDYADEGNTFVMKADGSAVRLNEGWFSWSSRKSRWELIPFAEKANQIEPGDIIVAPEEVTRIAWLREIKDITQILMQAAVVAGVVIKLF